MNMAILHRSHHARQQQARRNLSDADVQFVLEYGQRRFSAGAMHVFLGGRDLPKQRAIYQRFRHLEGTVLVVRVTNAELVLITVYRNRQTLKKIRAKHRYDLHKMRR